MLLSNVLSTGFLITAGLTVVPSILFQTRLIMYWGVLSCHIWDLEDRRISPLAFLIASGVHMIYITVLSTIVAFAIAYGIFGWAWASFWDVVLFSTMLTLTSLQFGKMLCAAIGTYQAVAGVYSVYIYLGMVVSGFVVNPAKIPSYFRWVMYFSLSFWGISGAELTQLEHISIGEEQCLTMISCIVLNRNWIAQATGFTLVTTAHISMVALFVAAILLVLIEYCFLLRKVQQRGNFEKVKQPSNSRASVSGAGKVNADEVHLLMNTSNRDTSLEVLESHQNIFEDAEIDTILEAAERDTTSGHDNDSM